MLPRTALVLVLVACSAGAAESQPAQQVSLDLQPKSIAVFPWDEFVDVRVVLQNAGPAAVVNATLTPFSTDGVEVREAPAPVTRLSADDSVTWTIRVGLARARVPGSLQFELAYRLANIEGSRRIFQALQIQAAASGMPDKPIEATVSGSFGAINETRRGDGYLLVTNNLDVPARVTRVAVLRPDAQSLIEPEPIAPFDVPARSTESRPIALTASSQVSPGKHVVLFGVDAEWNRGGRPYTRRLMVAQEVTVGVFFESEILKALGVPSFLLLPGCLFLFTMQLLLAFGWLGLDRHSKLPTLTVTSPGFWIIAITYSAVFALFYTYVTGTDYLIRYGARDLRNVWLTSIGVGVGVYAMFALVTARIRRLRVPATTDSHVEILRKMGRAGLSIQAMQVEFKMNDRPVKAFVIEPLDDDQVNVWVAPRIRSDWKDDKESLTNQQRVSVMINDREKAEKVAEIVAAAYEKQQTTLEWNSTDSVSGPYHLKVANITRFVERDSILDVV